MGRVRVRLGLPMKDASILTHGTVREQVKPVLFRVALPNGKEILAHLSKELAEAGAVFEPGDVLLVEMTPYDFDGGRILERVDG